MRVSCIATFSLDTESASRSALARRSLSDNQLSSTIPSSLGSLTRLNHLCVPLRCFRFLAPHSQAVTSHSYLRSSGLCGTVPMPLQPDDGALPAYCSSPPPPTPPPSALPGPVPFSAYCSSPPPPIPPPSTYPGPVPFMRTPVFIAIIVLLPAFSLLGCLAIWLCRRRSSPVGGPLMEEVELIEDLRALRSERGVPHEQEEAAE